MKETKKQKKIPSKKKLIAGIISVLSLVLAAVILTVVLLPKDTEAYRLLNSAIDNSESLDDFFIEYETRTIVNFGDATRDIATAGHFVSFDNMDTVAIEVNTESYYSYNEELNGKATATFYSEDNKVYDVTSGAKQPADISYNDFKKLLDGFSLYRYSPSKVKDEQLVKNQNEKISSATVTVSLDSVEDKLLKSYAQEISTLAEEAVKPSDLNPVAAYVQYNIFEDKILSQTYTFTVEYKASNSELLKYTVISTISYVEDFTDEDVDEYIPFDF